MNIVEKRDFIHSHLHQTEDKFIDEMFKKMQSCISEEKEELSAELKTALNAGLESLEQGRSSSHEEVMSRMRKKYPNLVK